MYSLVHKGLNVLKVGICVKRIQERQHSLKHHLVLLLKYRTHNSTQLLSSPKNDQVLLSENTSTLPGEIIDAHRFLLLTKLVTTHLNIFWYIIGASLSEPHTSVTLLHTCVCMLACLLGPTTYRKF